MSDEKKSEALRVMELQRSAINLLEQIKDDWKAAYQHERERAESLEAILVELGGCSGCGTSHEKTERELTRIYGIV